MPDRRRVGDTATSKTLHALQSLSARSGAAALAAAGSTAILAWAVASGRPDHVLTWFESVSSAVTLVLVFTLQHTHARQQSALHRKLDELLHALPNADDRLISLESASGDDLMAVEQRHSELRDQATSGRAD